MNEELSALNLASHFKELLGLEQFKTWNLQMPGPLEVRAFMSPEKATAESFQVALRWSAYPDKPPSMKFVDTTSGRLDLPIAWPCVRGFRPQSLDACVNYCAEGFALHPEWNSDPRYRWDPRHNALLRVLNSIQGEMNDSFQGRFKQ